MCQLLFRFCSVALLSGAETIIFGSKQCKITLMMFHSAFPVANSFGLCVGQLLSMGAKCTWPHRMGAIMVSRSRRGSVPFPESGVHVHIRPADAVVGSASGDDPQLVNIDCTGLGGHDLSGFKDYDICLRTDKHSQSIYGPSVTPLESPGRDGTHQVTLVALGGSKAMHEFLVLHYLATDSAREWDVFLDSCLPVCTWVRAGSRRALALHMYDKCHIAPSHRRFAHPSWIAGMKLMLDLLLGARKHRYLGRCLVDPRPAQVYVRGFPAGSYSGICLLHLLWNMPHVQVGGILGGISCPPALLHGILPEHGDRLMLIHLTTDRLCQWHPYDETLSLP